jgi:glutathione S-transferase
MHWGILDARLAAHAYVVGNTLTLADVVFGPHVHRWMVLDIPGKPEWPNLKRWYERLAGNKAFAANLMIKPV